MSWKKGLFILIIVVAALASVFTVFPELAGPISDWMDILSAGIGLGLSDLSKSVAEWFASLPGRLNSVVDWIAKPALILFSVFGISLPREAAAMVTVGSVALIGVLFLRSSFTKIAYRNIPRRKLRNALTVISIVLGVSLVVGVNVAFDSAFAQFKLTVNKASGNVDVNIRSALDSPIDQVVLETVRGVEGVANASARVSGEAVILEFDNDWEATILEFDGDWEAATVVGIDTRSDFSYLDPDTRIVRRLDFITFTVQLEVNGSQAVVDEGLNREIGDRIQVYAITDLDQANASDSEPFDFSRLHSLNVVGIYHPEYIGEGSGRHTIYVDLVKAQEIFDRQGEIDHILVKVTHPDQTDAVVDGLRGELGAKYIITPVKEKILNEMSQAFLGFQAGLQVMSALALSVAVIIILNTIYMSVGERTSEIGTLRSIGSSKRQIFWIFFAESLTLGFIGVMIGLLLGIPISVVFMAISSYLQMTLMPPVSTFVITPWHFALGIATGLISTLVGGMFPSVIASRMEVVKALRPAMRRAGKSRTSLMMVAVGLPLTLVGAFIFAHFTDVITTVYELFLVVPLLLGGLILLAAGFLGSASSIIEHFLIAFGRTRKIIARNISRNLTRSTICFTLTAMTLSFFVVMAGAQAGVISGLEDVIYSFYSADVTISSQTSLSRSFADDLEGVEDGALISLAAPAFIIPRRILLSTPEVNSTCMVLAIDPETYSDVMSMTFSDETPVDVLGTFTSRSIVLTSPLAESLRVTVDGEINMQVSEDDSAPLENFDVIGIAVGTILEWEHGLYSSPLSEACYISYESLNAFFPKYIDAANLFFLRVEPGQDVDSARERITESFGDEYPLNILTVNDALEPATRGINETFIILNTVVMFAVGNAAIGVAAIMVMNVSERRREIGIMRSQGMSVLRVVLSIMGEAIVLSTMGFIVGTIAGLIIHRVTVTYMYIMGFTMPYIIPYDAIGLSLALAVLASFISAAYPAYRASKINIIEALRRTT